MVFPEGNGSEIQPGNKYYQHVVQHVEDCMLSVSGTLLLKNKKQRQKKKKKPTQLINRTREVSRLCTFLTNRRWGWSTIPVCPKPRIVGNLSVQGKGWKMSPNEPSQSVVAQTNKHVCVFCSGICSQWGQFVSAPSSVSWGWVTFYDRGSEVTDHHFIDEADQGEGKITPRFWKSLWDWKYFCGHFWKTDLSWKVNQMDLLTNHWANLDSRRCMASTVQKSQPFFLSLALCFHAQD